MDRKKELIAAYKQRPPRLGIYQIKNIVSGKIFIGSSADPEGKINSNRFQLRMGSHPNKELQKDWNENGEDNFSFEVLDVLKPLDDPGWDGYKELKTLEELWLEKLQPYDEKGYNKKAPSKGK